MRQKDYPRQVLVGRSMWTIKFVRVINHDVGPGKICVGLCLHETQTILIRQSLDPRERLEVFCHELLHAIEDEYEVDIGHKIIYKLDKALAMILIENFLPHFKFKPPRYKI